MLCRNAIEPPFIGPQCHSCLGKQGFAIYETPLLPGHLGVVATRYHRAGTMLGQYRGANELVGPNCDYAVVCGELVVDASDPHQSNWTRYCNHAADGSLHCNSELALSGKRVLLMATRDIAIGHEIMLDYGDAYWSNRKPPVRKRDSRASMCTRFSTFIRVLWENVFGLP